MPPTAGPLVARKLAVYGWTQARTQHGGSVKLKISQKADAFFDLFARAAQNLRETAELLRSLF